jgi:hypothetical protein
LYAVIPQPNCLWIDIVRQDGEVIPV